MFKTHEVKLNGYKATFDNSDKATLGTKDSYGVEQIKVTPGASWSGLVITAVFSHAGNVLANPVVVPEDGVIEVPAGATAQAFTRESPGLLVFRGVSDGVQRITVDLPYTVANHAPVDGTAPAPTPSEWEQFVSQVGADADRSESAAQQAEDAADRAGQAAENAAASEKSAAQSAAAALQSANAAAQSAKNAAAELGKVQNASTEALSGIGDAKQSALTDIASAKDGAVSAVTGAGTTQTGKVENAGTEALKGIDTAKTSAISAVGAAGTKAEQDIGTAKETALKAISDAQGQATQAVQQAGTTEVGKVNDAGSAQTKAIQDEGTKQTQAVTKAGDAKLDEINKVNALLPTPTEADAGKAPIAQPDGSYALEQVTVDAYTRAEADARYAPIEAAIKVSGKGTGLVSLSSTVAWGMQGLKVFGKSTQKATTGAQLFDAKTCLASQIEAGIIFINADGSLTLNGTFGTMECSFKVTLPAGTYYFNDSDKIFHVLSPTDTLWTHTVILEEETELYCYVASGTYSNKVVKPMINAGSIALPWEPYTGGMASPNLEYPQEIVSTGDDGQVDATVCGANFLEIPDGDYSRIGVTISNENGIQVVSGTAGATGDVRSISFTVPVSGKYRARSSGNINSRLFQNGSIRSNSQNVNYVLECQAGDEITMTIYVTSGGTYNSKKVYQWITAGEADMPFTSYVELQQLPIPTPDGLPGIPVDSGGNWVDESGQQWVSDVVDLAAGTKTQNLIKYKAADLKFNSDFYTSAGKQIHRFSTSAADITNLANRKKGLSNIFTWIYSSPVVGINFTTNESRIRIYMDESFETSEQVSQFLSEKNAEFLLQLATPVTTPLSAEEIAAYRALTTYPGTTNIIAPDAGIEASALADPNQYIEDRIQAAITQAVTQAIALTGGNA